MSVLLHPLNGRYTIRPKQKNCPVLKAFCSFSTCGLLQFRKSVAVKRPFSSPFLLAWIGLRLICLSHALEKLPSSLAAYQTQPITHFDLEDGNHMLLRNVDPNTSTILTQYHNPNDPSLILYSLQIRIYCHLYYWL
jgi:hypothetical protein